MRTITADVLQSEYKLNHPVSIICSGSSGSGKVSFKLNRINIELNFKTSFIENLIRHRKFTKNPRKIYYIYPKELEIPPVKVSIYFYDSLL